MTEGLRFIDLGEITISALSRHALAEAYQDIEQFLAQHQRGDWGEMNATGKAHNGHAAVNDLDVTSYYRLRAGVILTITTEFDRSFTRVDLFSTAGS